MAPPIAEEWQSATETHLAAKKQSITLISESFVLVFLDGFLPFMDESENSPTELSLREYYTFGCRHDAKQSLSAERLQQKFFFTSMDTLWQHQHHAAPEH